VPRVNTDFPLAPVQFPCRCVVVEGLEDRCAINAGEAIDPLDGARGHGEETGMLHGRADG
jgi:hypothetical protein